MDASDSQLELLDIDRRSATPVYAQLTEQIRLLIRRGVLNPNDALPTVRSLAVELGINANTVSRVYRDLQREGWLRLERGLGTFVAGEAPERTVQQGTYRELERKVRDVVKLSQEAGLHVG